MNEHIKSVLVDRRMTIKQTMAVIERAPKEGGPAGIAAIVDKDHKLLGIVTDGDIREAILAGVDLDSPVEEIMTKDPITVNASLSDTEKYEMALQRIRHSRRMLDRAVGRFVVVDDGGKIEDIISFFELWKRSEIKSRDICVLGLGYVGLTLAVSLADVGFNILGVDTNQDVVETVQHGSPHFHEVGLAASLNYHLDKRLRVSTELDSGDHDVYVICVGTPIDENHKTIMTYVRDAGSMIGKVLKRGDLVIVRSTVPVGTSRNHVLPILERESGLKGGQDFHLACAPERTVAGQALKELKSLPQVIGGLDKQSLELASNLFRELTPVIVSVDTLEAAEMVKLINNAFRDFVFAFSNELALICDKWNLDAAKVIEAANEGYPRDTIPLPSPGVGGVCLRKDPYILVETVRENGYEPKLIGRSREINEYMPFYIYQKMLDFCKAVKKDIGAIKIFVVGFAFKGRPETSDMRDSSTLQLVDHLSEVNENIYGYDPVISKRELREEAGVIACDLDEGFRGADCVVVMNNHPSYVKWDIYSLFATLNKPALFFDGWHMFSPEDICRIKGVFYGSLGVALPGNG